MKSPWVWILLLGIALLTLIPASQLPRLEVDTSNQSMSAQQQPIHPTTDRPSLLIAVHGNQPLTFPQWRQLSELSLAINQSPGVTQALLPLISAEGWTVRLLQQFSPQATERLQDLLRLLRSKDGKTVGILVLLEPQAAIGLQRTQTLAQLRDILNQYRIEGLETCLVGLPVVNETVGEMIERDQGLLLPLSVGVIALLLWLIYRNPMGVIVPMAVIGLAVVWTLGLYAWQVRQLNVITSLLAPVIMILSLATAIHVVEAFQSSLQQGQTPHEAVRKAVQRVWRPCLFSALTTAAGLASLRCSSIPAVRLFGLYGAIGVCLSFIFGLTVTPLLLSWHGWQRCSLASTSRGTNMNRLLTGCTSLGWDHPKLVMAGLLGLSLLTVLGLSRLHSNTNLIDFLPQQSELVRTSRLVDEHLIGINPLTCRITPPPQDTKAFLETAAQLDSINGLHVESSEPFDVTLYVRAIGSRQALSLLTTLNDLARFCFGPQTETHFSGYFHSIVTESDQLVGDLVRSFGLALTVITLLIGLQLRSLKATLLSLVPNLLSVFWIFGVMGLAGIDLSTGTAMIACVVLGLAVDHTIHYLSFLRHNPQPDLNAAISDTAHEVGPALVVSTFILAVGFGVGITGSFKPTIYFSLFTALAMLAALFCNLTVIPTLLRLTKLELRWVPAAFHRTLHSSNHEEVEVL